MSDEPKLFISYSWAGPRHEEWVLTLATELRGAGVDVVLDKWDLREGHDANAFMERMVTDPSVAKVILVCDRTYAEKADAREGGVGTEAQIITPELYAKREQDKFVAVLAERDRDGNPYLPAYYASRVYIDLSDSSEYSTSFEQLVRWAYDKPLLEKPPLGATPTFLTELPVTSLDTRLHARRAIDAARSRPEQAVPSLLEYVEKLGTEFEKLRLDGDPDPFDDAVVKSIEDFLPTRNEIVELMTALALYHDSEDTRESLHRLFETLIPYLERPSHINSWREWDFDNYRFVIHELLLYAIAIQVKHRRYETADYLMRYEYFVSGRSEYGQDVMVPFAVIRSHMRSLEERNRRLQLRRLSLRADLLKERCTGVGIQFRELLQADFILYIRDALHRGDALFTWWPDTLLYTFRQYGPLEEFARARSTRHFERCKVLLGIGSKEDLVPYLEALRDGKIRVPTWEGQSFAPAQLLGYDALATVD